MPLTLFVVLLVLGLATMPPIAVTQQVDGLNHVDNTSNQILLLHDLLSELSKQATLISPRTATRTMKNLDRALKSCGGDTGCQEASYRHAMSELMAILKETR